MHKTTYDKMNWFKNNYLNPEEPMTILDVGSLDTSDNNYNYKSIFENPKWDYKGLDFENGKNVDILVKDIYNWQEINNNSYDVIISGQLFEHLGFFWLTMNEIARVLKPGGICCIIVPSDGPKHGSSNIDCYRFKEDSMEFLAKYVDFNVLHISTNTSKESKPWNDTCLVAKKPGNSDNSINLEQRINNLESKLDTLIKKYDI